MKFKPEAMNNIEITQYQNSYISPQKKSQKHGYSQKFKIIKAFNFFKSQHSNSIRKIMFYLICNKDKYNRISICKALIADIAGISTRQVQRLLKILKDIDYIRVVDKGLSAGFNKNNINKNRIPTYEINNLFNSKKLRKKLSYLAGFGFTFLNPEKLQKNTDAYRFYGQKRVDVSLLNIYKDNIYLINERLKLEEQFQKEQKSWKARECFLNAKSRFDLETASVCPRPQAHSVCPRSQVRSVCPRSQNIFPQEEELGIVVSSQKQAICPPEFPSFLDSS